MGYSLCDIHGLFIVWHKYFLFCSNSTMEALDTLKNPVVCDSVPRLKVLWTLQIAWIVKNFVSMYIVKAEYEVMNILIFVWIYKIRFNCKIVSDQELWWQILAFAADFSLDNNRFFFLTNLYSVLFFMYFSWRCGTKFQDNVGLQIKKTFHWTFSAISWICMQG